MFLLSSGSHLDYEGYRQWMIRSSPELFESIRFVLCLDDLMFDCLDVFNISSSKDLVLRVSRHAHNDDLQRLYSSFEAVAKEMSVNLEVDMSVSFLYPDCGRDSEYYGGASDLSS